MATKFRWYDKELVKKTHTEIQKAILKGCIMVEVDAKKLCPVDLGTLMNSITHEVEETVGRVGSNIEYAPYVEFGTGIYAEKGKGRKTPWVYKTIKGWFFTHGNKPQPYLRPALHKNEKKIIKLFKNIL